VILSQVPLLDIAPFSSRGMSGFQSGQLRTLEAMEREYILRTLEQTAWVISGVKDAAAILGMNPNTLRSRMLKVEISRMG
jgi:formate hydrogenlyase transcriptional activator